MRRPALSAVAWAMLGVLACIAASAHAAQKQPAATPTVDLRQQPMGGKAPIDISVGLYITNFVAIDETRESFEVGGYLTAQWKDPRLALPLNPAGSARDAQPAKRTYQLGDIWAPAIETANSISHKSTQYFLEADRDGIVTYIERFDAVLSNDFDMRKFPFDRQVLQFEFEPFLSASSDIRFAPRPLPATGISPEQHTELAAWQIKELRYTAEKATSHPQFPAANEALFQLEVVRRSGFYVWKIFLPLILLTMIPAVVFWIDVELFDWLLKIPMTMLLSMVAFEFTIARDLPRIGYLTFLDAVFLLSFAFCFLCIFEILIVFLLQKRGRRSLAVKLHTAGRWAYPAAYFGVLLLLAIGFLA